jgi:hypothetical protein
MISQAVRYSNYCIQAVRYSNYCIFERFKIVRHSHLQLVIPTPYLNTVLVTRAVNVNRDLRRGSLLDNRFVMEYKGVQSSRYMMHLPNVLVP